MSEPKHPFETGKEGAGRLIVFHYHHADRITTELPFLKTLLESHGTPSQDYQEHEAHGCGPPPGRSAAAAEAAAKKPPAVGPNRASSAVGSGPKISKDELRAQLEKLERANVSLRAKSREANRQAKADTARIAELEDRVARLEKDAESRSESAKHEPESAAAVGMNPQSRAVDPSEEVSPGITPEDSVTPDDEAKTAREKLDEPVGIE